MADLFWERDADLDVLVGKTVAVLGYGSQGTAHALNLRESGVDVVLGLRQGGPSWSRALEDNWQPVTPGEAVARAQVVAVLVPDMAQPRLFREEIQPRLKAGMTLLFAHGFNVHFGSLTPPENVDVVLVAPKGPGHLVRRQFKEGKGVPCLLAVRNDASGAARSRALAYAKGLGGTRAGVLSTTFEEETETDLFGEQAVLCGGVTELVRHGFETLVDAGYQAEVAYFECLHELKLIVDLLYEGGFAKMHQYVSETAIFGDLTRGPRVVDQGVRRNMEQVLQEIRNGDFAREWASENQAGLPRYRAMQKADLSHKLETVGRDLRRKMAWLQEAPAEIEEAIA